MTRYVIIGAGAIGGGIGGRLAEAGHDVVLVARGAHLAALRRRGIRLRSPDSDVFVAVAAVGGPDELQLQDSDVLVLATKTQQATEALVAWADAPVVLGRTVVGTAGDRLPVLTALNGVASEELALRYYSRVFGVCVWMPAVHLEPGEVILRNTPTSGMFHIGRVPVDLSEAADRELLAEIQSSWSSAGLAVRLPEDVLAWKYRKLLSNLANALQALAGPGQDIEALAAAADREARHVLDLAGIGYIGDAEERAARDQGSRVAAVPGEPPELGGSTWQSLARGTGNVESDYLNGEISAIAHRIGIDAPINSRVASLARMAAARGQRPGDVSVGELASLLGLGDS